MTSTRVLVIQANRDFIARIIDATTAYYLVEVEVVLRGSIPLKTRLYYFLTDACVRSWVEL